MLLLKQTFQVIAMVALLVFLIEGSGIDGNWLFYETGTMQNDGVGALGIPLTKFVSEGYVVRWNSLIALIVIFASLSFSLKLTKSK